jgi:hypothetical protein
VEGTTVVFVFAVPSLQEDVVLGVLVLVEEPEVLETLPKFVLELRAMRRKVLDEGFGWWFTEEGKDNLRSVGKSVYGGAGHPSLMQLDMVLITERGFLQW